MAALFSLPNSGTERMVYGIEVGVDWEVKTKSTAKKLLVLMGEGSYAGATPAGFFMLNLSVVHTQQKVKAISEKVFMEKQPNVLKAGIQQSQADSDVDILQLVNH